METPSLPNTQELDDMRHLPTRNSISIALVLAVAGLNAFNDNILKMMLVGLAPKVVEGQIGTNIGAWLGAIILMPYIIFAPLAGWLADRFSKRAVIMAMLVAQAAILLLAGACFRLALGRMSIILALGAFFLLAVQSTFFSPAKMGILKELAGSRRLGMVAGWLQMVTMAGILSGLWLGGEWFDLLFARTGNPWVSAATPIWILFGVAMVALAAGFVIQRTPHQTGTEFHLSMLWEHFGHLRESLAHTGMRRAFMGNAAYWFVASMAAAMFVDIGIALHPGTSAGGAASASSHMTLMVGAGTMLGSLFASWVNRGGLQLGIIPLAALGMALTLIVTGALPPGTGGFSISLMTLGFVGGCYLVPLQAYIQDKADSAKRGRALSAMNLLDSLAGIMAVVFLVGMKMLGFGVRGQFWALGLLMLAGAIYIIRILPQDLLRFIVLSIVRALYKVKVRGSADIPAQGGVLLLPNHVSYVDAVIVGAACSRPVRFVMWDVLYKLWWLNWFLRLVGTVPISATRAKDAVRTVAAALKEGEVVCLFPEGQITRHGMVNELRKGFELMARQADVPVLPVYLEGLYGSVFSYEGGVCFRKWPKKLRYPVTVLFGRAIAARQATADAVREEMLALSCDGLLARVEFDAPELPGKITGTWTALEKSQAMANALRLREIEWVHKGDVLLCLDDEDSHVFRTLLVFTYLRPDVRLAHDISILAQAKAQSVVAAGSAASLSKLTVSPYWNTCGRFAMCWQGMELGVPDSVGHFPVLPGILDTATGAMISASVPDPRMPLAEAGNQHGCLPGSLGRLLPGLRFRKVADGLVVEGIAPAGTREAVNLPGVTLNAEGFLVRG